MYSDVSVTVYPHTDKCKGGRGGKRTIEFGVPTKRALDVGKQRWEQMKRDKAQGKDRGFSSGYSPA